MGSATPHYFSVPNYANSPMPGVVSLGNPLLARSFGTDFSPRVFNIVPAALPNGELQDFQTFNQAGLNPSAGQNFNAYVLRPTGVANQYNVVFDSGRLTVPSLPPGSSGQIETYPLATPVPVQAGDVIAFYGRGIPFTPIVHLEQILFAALFTLRLSKDP
ncbi:MAG: hypothetical protein IPH82_14605 [Chloroflexi bacterium]|nr:hypothetical protein [Chloroflexota bacterium]